MAVLLCFAVMCFGKHGWWLGVRFGGMPSALVVQPTLATYCEDAMS